MYSPYAAFSVEDNWRFVRMFLIMGGTLVLFVYLKPMMEDLNKGEINIPALIGIIMTTVLIKAVDSWIDQAAGWLGKKAGKRIREHLESVKIPPPRAGRHEIYEEE